MTVVNTYTVAFTEPVTPLIAGVLEGREGRALAVTEWSLSNNRLSLMIETTQGIREVIKFIAPLVEVSTIGLITQTIHYEPNWLEFLK
jgi:hypothetical protein